MASPQRSLFNLAPDYVFDWGNDDDGTEVFGGEVGGYDIFARVHPSEQPNPSAATRKVSVIAHETLLGWPDHRIHMQPRDIAFPEPWETLSAERKLEMIQGVGMFAILNGLEQKLQGAQGVNYV